MVVLCTVKGALRQDLTKVLIPGVFQGLVDKKFPRLIYIRFIKLQCFSWLP